MDYIWIMTFENLKKLFAKLASGKTAEPSKSEQLMKGSATASNSNPSSSLQDPKSSMAQETGKKPLDVRPGGILDVTQPPEREKQQKPTEPGADPPSGPSNTSTGSRYHSWVPQCPHCDRANEYGYPMCDPVHPRMCAGGDF